MQTVAVRLKTPSISSERMHSINSFKNDLRKKGKQKYVLNHVSFKTELKRTSL